MKALRPNRSLIQVKVGTTGKPYYEVDMTADECSPRGKLINWLIFSHKDLLNLLPDVEGYADSDRPSLQLKGYRGEVLTVLELIIELTEEDNSPIARMREELCYLVQDIYALRLK